MRFITIKSGLLLGLLAAGGLTACMSDGSRNAPRSVNNIGAYELPSISHGDHTPGFDEMIAAMSDARAVLVGEVHDRLDHHLNQLEIIKRLHERHHDLAIGMEQFQQPFQSALDRYVAGSIDTGSMLLETEYYRRWKLDYRLYEPVLSYARSHEIPVIALNLPQELTRKVAAQGLAALSDEEAARVPELDRSNRAYRERLKEVYDKHPMSEHGGGFERFHTAQLLWDEGMAARAAEYLEAHPGTKMVVLAGEGHIEHGWGIPDRLARRIEGKVVTAVHVGEKEAQRDRADYVLHSQPVELPARGLLGVVVDPHADSARINELSEDSAAHAAGMQTGDRITAVDGRPVGSLAELKTRLWDKQPGDTVSVTVARGPDETFAVDVTLR